MTPSRKRRLDKLAAAQAMLEATILTLRREQVAYAKDESTCHGANAAANADFAALYYLSRLARKAP